MALFKQSYSAAMQPGLRGITLGQLMREVRNDPAVTGSEKARLINDIRAASGGAPTSTPVSALAAGAAGGVIANLAGRYFGMSTVGRTIATVAGFGIGRQLQNRLKPEPTRNMQGWRF